MGGPLGKFFQTTLQTFHFCHRLSDSLRQGRQIQKKYFIELELTLDVVRFVLDAWLRTRAALFRIWHFGGIHLHTTFISIQ